MVNLLLMVSSIHGRNVSGTGHIFSVNPCEFHVYSCDRKILATRTQLPIIIGYAMTGHRSQGFSLDTVAILISHVCHLGVRTASPTWPFLDAVPKAGCG